MPFLRTQDITAHYRIDGDPSAPAIVFSNSLGTDLRIWDGIVELLAPRYRLIRYDNRGHGLSDTPPGPYDVATLAGDLAALLDGLNITEAVVCGLSVGGQIALQLATMRPKLVKALVLSDTGCKIGSDELWNARIDTAMSEGLEPMADAVMERWFSASYAEARAIDLQGWRNMLARQPALGYAGVCAALRDADLEAAARALSLPSLCLVGSDDRATPPHLVQALSTLIPGARFETIDGPGHLPCIEKPDAYAAVLDRFIGDIGA